MGADIDGAGDFVTACELKSSGATRGSMAFEDLLRERGGGHLWVMAAFMPDAVGSVVGMILVMFR